MGWKRLGIGGLRQRVAGKMSEDIRVDVDDPEVQRALTGFTVEAIDEARDLLRYGDMPSRMALIKMVLSGALKAKAENGAAEAEEILEQTRKAVAGIFDEGE
jgi:hypothetical protein